MYTVQGKRSGTDPKGSITRLRVTVVKYSNFSTYRYVIIRKLSIIIYMSYASYLCITEIKHFIFLT